MVNKVTITHWLPIVTYCPVNNLPDFIYVECTYHNQPFVELYQLRKRMRHLLQGRKLFMEECAELVHKELKPDVTKVRLIFNKHIIEVGN